MSVLGACLGRLVVWVEELWMVVVAAEEGRSVCLQSRTPTMNRIRGKGAPPILSSKKEMTLFSR